MRNFLKPANWWRVFFYWRLIPTWTTFGWSKCKKKSFCRKQNAHLSIHSNSEWAEWVFLVNRQRGRNKTDRKIKARMLQAVDGTPEKSNQQKQQRNFKIIIKCERVECMLCLYRVHSLTSSGRWLPCDWSVTDDVRFFFFWHTIQYWICRAIYLAFIVNITCMHSRCELSCSLLYMQIRC